jgi:hypothetical protein
MGVRPLMLADHFAISMPPNIWNVRVFFSVWIALNEYVLSEHPMVE